MRKNRITRSDGKQSSDLPDSIERYKLFFDTMAEGVGINELIYDESKNVIDYRIIDVNPAFLKNLSFTKEQVIGKMASDLYGMSGEYIASWWKKNKGKKKPVEKEYYHQSANRWFIIKTTLPESSFFATIFTEITEQKISQKVLEEQYSTLNSIINCTDALIFSVDLKYCYTSFNRQHAEIMKQIYGTEIKIGTSILDFMTVGEDREKAKKNIDSALAGEHLTREAYSGEESRSRRYFTISHSPVRNESGEIIGVSVFSQDITERKISEDSINRLNRELRAISTCNQTLLRVNDEPTLLNEICRIICDEAGYRLAWVGFTENDENRTIRPVAWAGYNSGYIESARLSWSELIERGRGPAGLAIRNKEIIYIQDFSTDQRFSPWKEDALQRGYHSGIALPLKDQNGNVFGVLLIYSSERDFINRDEIRIMEELSGDLSFGITTLRIKARNIRIENILQSRVRLLEYAINHTLDEFLTATLDEIGNLTGSAIGFYNFLDQDQATIVKQNWSTKTPLSIFRTENIKNRQGFVYEKAWIECIKNQVPVIHNDYASSSHCKGMLKGDPVILRELAVPVFRGNRIKAIIAIGNKSADYGQDDLEIVSCLGDLSWDIAENKLKEERLCKSEAELKEAQRVGKLGSWDWDSKSDKITWSEEYYRIYGFDPALPPPGYEEHLKTYTPESAARLDVAVKESMRTGIPYEIDLEHVRPDGTKRWIRARSEIKKDSEGLITGLCGTAQDITDRKTAEIKLSESQERLETVFIKAADGILIADEELKKFVFCNPMICNMLGYTSDEILTLGVSEIHPRDDLPYIFDQFERQARKEFTLARNIPMKRKDGSVFYADINSFPLTLEGRPCLAGFFRDITQQKSAEDELRKLSQAVEQSPVSIIVTDTGGCIEYVNAKFEEVTGYKKSEVLGKNPRILKSGEKPPAEYEILWKLITSGKEWQGEFRNRKKSGEYYWELASISPIFDSKGKITHFLGVKEDITLRKKYESELIIAKEKAVESDKLKTAFLHNISHEIRTPLNGIVGFSSLLSEPELDYDRRMSFISSITESSDQLLAIVSDIIEVSNLEAGIVNCKVSEVDLNSIVRSLANQYEIEASRKGLMFITSMDLSGDDIKIMSDGPKIIQILTNLINNALKFTSKGNIRLGYSVKDNFIEFIVADTGIGIHTDYHEKIFNRFYQVENQPTRQYGGTGLGLAISKAYAELLGGSIWLDSEPGRGSIFYFTIPLRRKEQKNENKVIAPIVKEHTLPPMTILVAEDNDLNFKLIDFYLSGLGMKLLRATNGYEAMEICRSVKNIDLILMDLKMPEMDGWVATKIIKDQYPKIPVVFQTAYIVDRESAKKIGCSDILSKPFKKEELLTILYKYSRSEKD